MKCVGLIDCNNFFVSCERLFRPDLIGRPVVVLSSNDGCVIARSQEIKDKGIPMGVPYFQVKDTLSNMKTTVFSSNFTLYRDISRRVFSVLRRELGVIEQYSIDECFFEVAEDSAVTVAARVQKLVLQEVGIPVSVGVGFSKTQAKFAAAQAKRTGGVCVFGIQVTRQEFLQAKLTEIWGVGRGRSTAFLRNALVTVDDYLRCDPRALHGWFGIEGVRLYDELKGTVHTTLSEVLISAKTHTSSRSFGAVCMEKASLKTALIGHLEVLLEKLFRERSKATALRVMFYPGRHSDYLFHGVSVDLTLPIPTDDQFLFTKLIDDVVETYFRLGVPYKKAGITLTIMPSEAVAVPLFKSANKRTEDLSLVVSDLNQRLGRAAVRIGQVKDSARAVWLPRQTLCSPCYTTQWKSLRKVVAKDTCS